MTPHVIIIMPWLRIKYACRYRAGPALNYNADSCPCTWSLICHEYMFQCLNLEATVQQTRQCHCHGSETLSEQAWMEEWGVTGVLQYMQGLNAIVLHHIEDAYVFQTQTGTSRNQAVVGVPYLCKIQNTLWHQKAYTGSFYFYLLLEPLSASDLSWLLTANPGLQEMPLEGRIHVHVSVFADVSETVTDKE